MSDPRWIPVLTAFEREVARREAAGIPIGPFPLDTFTTIALAAVDAVSSQYEQVGWWNPKTKAVGRFTLDDGAARDAYEPVYARIEYADTRALIEHRSPAETAEAKAWSDDAHARIRAGKVSGSHELMRDKVGEYGTGTQEAENG